MRIVSLPIAPNGPDPYNNQPMTYQVLARKLRPADFSALVGQDHVVQALAHALDNDRLHHAYLFTGTRGVGKTTIARILARCLNCERGVSSTPCGECDACTAITEGRFVDLIEMDGASQRGVENVHNLQDGAQYMPNSGRYKVYLIDEVHMLTKEAFNALLKILEEPPAHVKFLLATTEAKKIPITILSRCLQFQLKNMTVERIAGYLADALQAESVPFEPGALRIIGTAAAGSMRDALSVTDQAISYGGGTLEEASVARMLGVTGRNELASLLDALAELAADKVLAAAAELAERGVDFAAVLADLLHAFHDIAVAQVLPGAADGSNATEGQERPADLVADSIGAGFAHRFAPDTVQLFYQIALRSHRDLAYSPDPRVGFEMALLRMLAFAPEDVAQQVPPAVAPAQAQTQTKPREQAESQGSPAEAAPLPRASDPFWYDLQSRLDIQGIVAMIMRNCVLLERSLPTAEQPGEKWVLQLDPEHDGMLSDRHPLQIARLLSELQGHEVQVKLQVAPPPWETPGMQLARERRERHAAAVQELKDSAITQSLLEAFGARLDESTIKALVQETTSAE